MGSLPFQEIYFDYWLKIGAEIIKMVSLLLSIKLLKSLIILFWSNFLVKQNMTRPNFTNVLFI